MIFITKLNGKQSVINADMIKTVEATPDTVITLHSDEKLVVTEPVDEIVERVVAYRRRLYQGLLSTDAGETGKRLAAPDEDK